MLLRQRPRRFSRACMTLFCIAAVAMLSAESAAAQQSCFLFFCPPGAQPAWQGTPVPDRQGEPARPFFSGQDAGYSAIYAESNGEPFPVPALRLSDVDPAYLRRSVYYPTDEQPGTIVIDPQAHFLYLVEGGWARHSLWRRRWPKRIRMVGRRHRSQQAGMARLVST